MKIEPISGKGCEVVFSVFMLLSYLLSIVLSYVVQRLLPQGVSVGLIMCLIYNGGSHHVQFMERCCYRSEHRFEESELVDYFLSSYRFFSYRLFSDTFASVAILLSVAFSFHL